MIISKLLKILFVSLFIFSVGASAVPSTGDSCGCHTNCSSLKVKEPSWWGWLTKQNSSQFHFFDLIELLNRDDNSELSVKQDKTKAKQQVKS